MATITLLLLCLKTDVDGPLTHNYKEEFRGLAYREANVGGLADCTFLYDSICGAEIKAKMWGLQQVRVAYDNSNYWFWIRPYDSRSYYICPSSDVPNVSLIPPLRPSFLRWILNRETESSSFADGDYVVEIVLKEGSVTSQKYLRGGAIDAEVKVLAFQESGGMKFPALAILYMASNNTTMTIDLGRVEVNPSSKPDTSVPAGLKGKNLAP
jgi:hypothetical protein